MKKKLLSWLLTLLLLVLLLPTPAVSGTGLVYLGYEQIAHADRFASDRADALTAYARIADGMAALDAQIDLSDLSLPLSVATDVYELVRSDHPEYFWVQNTYGYSFNSASYCVRVSPQYYFEAGSDELATARAEFDASMARLLAVATDGMSDYEKALALHDALARHVVYDLAVSDQSAYSATVLGTGVCAGYARSYQYLLQAVGISAWTISGLGNGGSHAWNAVVLNGRRYYTDVTWDDGEDDGAVSYAYFNLPAARIAEDHEASELFADYTDRGDELTDRSMMYYSVTAPGGLLDRAVTADDGTVYGAAMDSTGMVRVYVDDAFPTGNEAYPTDNLNAFSSMVMNGSFYNKVFAAYTGVYGAHGGLHYGYVRQGREYRLSVTEGSETLSITLDNVSAPDGRAYPVAKTLRLYAGERMIAFAVTEKTSWDFAKLPAGDYRLEVSAAHFGTLSQDLTLSGGADATATLWMLGDLNGDGRINASDNTAMLRHIKGTKTLTGYALVCGDLNADGRVNASDNTAMLRHIKGTKSLWS
ncbi:MAG: hypothetical protein KIG36_02225 [Eubacteriales bacterium]|nr:hypothetical protein [Eubacteriales bacterium]